MSTNGVAVEVQVADDLADCGRLQEAMAGEAGGVQDVRGGRRAPDERVVVRRHLVETRPSVAQADVEQLRGAGADGLAEAGQPVLGVD